LALKLYPDDAEARRGLGAAYLALGDGRKALQSLAAAARLEPTDADLQLKLGLCHAQLGQSDKALDALQRAARLAPQNPEVDIQLAKLYAARGDADNAAFHYRKLIAAQPESIAPELELARLFQANDNHTLAINSLTQALIRHPAEPVLVDAIAASYAALGLTTEAISSYEQLLALKPDVLEARMAIAELHLAEDDFFSAERQARAQHALFRGVASQPDAVSVRLILAELLLRQGDVRGALAQCRYLAAVAPRNIAAQLMLADMLEQIGDLDGAIQCRSRLCELEPSSAEHLTALGDVLARRYELDEAADAYKRAVNIGRIEGSHGDAAAALGLAAAWASQGQYADALRLMDSVLAREPDNALALYGRAHTLQRSGEREEAIEAYKKLLAVAPDSPRGTEALLALYLDDGACEPAVEFVAERLKRGDGGAGIVSLLSRLIERQSGTQAAIEQMQALRKLAPSVPPVLKQLTALYERTKRKRDAAAARATVMAGDDGTPDERIARALTMAADERLGGAPTDIERALSLSASESASLQLMDLYRQGKRFEDAIAEAQRLVASHPNSIELHEMLAELHHENGTPEVAIAAFLRAREAHPGHPAADLGLARLYGLQGQWDEAVGVLRRVHDTIGQHPRVLAQLGSAEEHMGNMERATQLHGHAVFLTPGSAPFRERLAAALIRQDRLEEAIWELAHAVVLDAHSPAVELLPELAAADPARLQLIVESLRDRARGAPPTAALCTAVLQASQRAGNADFGRESLAALAASWPKSSAARVFSELEEEEAGEPGEDAPARGLGSSTNY